MVLVPLSDETKIPICGLEYRVVFATPEECPKLRGREGFTSCATNTIYIRKGLPLTRTIDVFLHEWRHAFNEASGVGSYQEDHFKGESYDKFEETAIRLEIPWIVRLLQDTGLMPSVIELLGLVPEEKKKSRPRASATASKKRRTARKPKRR